MAKLCPLSSSTSVSTFLVSRPGMLEPWNTRPSAKSSELTSGATCSRMVPRGVMCGRNLMRTPNSRNAIVTAPATAPRLYCRVRELSTGQKTGLLAHRW